MIVMILERVPTSLRGELSRWMLEVRTNVFVGNVSAMVRDRLWATAKDMAKGGAGTLIRSSASEQGFAFDTFGETSRTLRDFEGLLLVMRPRKP